MQRLAQVLGIAALAIAAAACSGGTAAPPSDGPVASPSGDEVVIVAKDLKFTTTSLTIKANEQTPIILDNQEAAPHNIAVKDASGEIIFKTEIVSSKKTASILPPMAAGSYPFLCEVHPDMVGTIEVQ
jgi:plastocyanin